MLHLRIYLLDFICLNSEHLRRNVHTFEIFSGKGNLTRAFQQRNAGSRASKYDIVDDSEQDFGSTKLVS